MDESKSYALKISLDKDSYDLMNIALKELNHGGYLYVNNISFMKMAIRFYSETVINSKEIGIAFKPKSKFEEYDRQPKGSKRNHMLAVNLDTELLNLMRKGIDCLTRNGFGKGFLKKITMASYARNAVIYYSQFVKVNQLGLVFTPTYHKQ